MACPTHLESISASNDLSVHTSRIRDPCPTIHVNRCASATPICVGSGPTRTAHGKQVFDAFSRSTICTVAPIEADIARSSLSGRFRTLLMRASGQSTSNSCRVVPNIAIRDSCQGRTRVRVRVFIEQDAGATCILHRYTAVACNSHDAHVVGSA
jgi:hypothetical protein